MEEIVGLLFTFLRILVIDVLFGMVFYWIGWPVCKIISFGRYPNSLESPKNDTFVSLLGLTVAWRCFCLLFIGVRFA
jgi:hypothetical protein